MCEIVFKVLMNELHDYLTDTTNCPWMRVQPNYQLFDIYCDVIHLI